MGGASEGVFVVTNLSVSNLVRSDNVLAVEVHQAAATSSDIVFGLWLGAQPTNEATVVITAQPQSLTVGWGDQASFAITVAASSQVFYQWLKDGQAIPNATNATFVIPKAKFGDDGSYSVMVSNEFARLASEAAQLTVFRSGPVPLVRLDDVWKYDQSGNDLGTSWREVGFNDSAWPSGRGVLAEEDNPAVTPLTNTWLSMTNPAGQFITTHYFRKHFSWTNDASFVCLTTSNLIDDGAVFYLNGTEIYRLNMSNGPVSASTLSSVVVTGAVEGVFIGTNLSAAGLVRGDNVLAVEVHQSATNSSDVVFGFSLTAQDTNTTPPDLKIVYATNAVLEANSNCQASMPDLTGTNFFLVGGDVGTVIVTQSVAVGTPLPLGTNWVVIGAADTFGSTAFSTNFVLVMDTTPPVISCSGNITLGTDAGQNSHSNVTYAASGTDNCGVVSLVCAPPNGSTFLLGMTTVTCVATDGSRNSAQCSFSVTVLDNEPPQLTCPTNIAFNTDTGHATKSNVTFTATATENTLVTNLACVPPSGSTFAVGTTTAACSATDSSGNTAQCSFTVTIRDMEPPQISCPGDLFLGRDAGQPSRSNVVYSITATDNCTVTNLSCVPPTRSAFPVGTNRVECVATDSSGQSNACAFNVVIADFLISATSEQVNTRIPDGSPLGLVSTLEVTSPIERITDVSVTLQLSGGFNGDLFAYLVHGSNHAILLNRPGKTLVNPLGYADAGFSITLNDAAAEGDIHAYRQTLFGNPATPLAGPLTGLWAPDGRDADPALVLDTEPRTATLSAFSGFNPNGRWTLFIADMDAGYTSTLVSWGLEIHGTNTPPVQALPPLSISWPEGLGLSLEGRGTAGQSCVLQTSSNLFDWFDYTNLFATTNGWFRFQENARTNLPSLFYRLRGP